jgi:glyoxylate reductase
MAILREAGEVHVSEQPLDIPAFASAVRGHEAIVCMFSDRVDAAVIEAAGPGLRIVANVAVGVDNIDRLAARARHIVVTNTPDVLTNAVAEFTWALILAVTRRVGEGDRLIRRGAWSQWSLDFMTGMELKGGRLGIVGAGRIGRAVAAKAAAFGMAVVFARRGTADRVDGHPTVSFDELLVTADVVSLHAPQNEETWHLIDRRALSRMKRTAYLVNASRGGLVDEEALAWALGERLIAGAALDVFEQEPAVHPLLLASEHVILTPHIGSATRHARTGMAELAARNVAAVLRGEPPITPVE